MYSMQQRMELQRKGSAGRPGSSAIHSINGSSARGLAPEVQTAALGNTCAEFFKKLIK